jgi:trimeric autotransporter adhesin
MVKRAHIAPLWLLIFGVSASLCACGGGGSSGVNSPPRASASSAAAITSFSVQGVEGVINDAYRTIGITMPPGTDVSAGIATFSTTGASVKVASTVQVSGATPNDFRAPVVYTVTAEDGSSKEYTVVVIVPSSSAKALTSYGLNGFVGFVNETGKTIDVMVPFGTDVTSLVASFNITGTAVKIGDTSQVSGTTTNDFSQPTVYTVVAADGTKADYTVNVSVAPVEVKEITSLSVNGVPSSINHAGASIVVLMPAESLNQIGVGGLSGGGGVPPVASLSFIGSSVSLGGTVQLGGAGTITLASTSTPVTLTVTAADGSTMEYTLTVEIADAAAKAMTSYSLAGINGVIDESNKTISVAMPSGMNLAKLGRNIHHYRHRCLDR